MHEWGYVHNSLIGSSSVVQDYGMKVFTAIISMYMLALYEGALSVRVCRSGYIAKKVADSLKRVLRPKGIIAPTALV